MSATHVEIRGQLYGVNSLLLPWVMRFYSGLQPLGDHTGLWYYSPPYIIPHTKFPAPTNKIGNEPARLYTKWSLQTSCCCREKQSQCLGIQIQPNPQPNPQPTQQSERVISVHHWWSLSTRCCSNMVMFQDGKEWYNSFKATVQSLTSYLLNLSQILSHSKLLRQDHRENVILFRRTACLSIPQL